MSALLSPFVFAVEDASQTITDGLALGGWQGYVLAAIGLLAVLVPVILKALGKSVPVLDSVIDVVVALARKVLVKQKADAEAKKGVESIVEVKKE